MLAVFARIGVIGSQVGTGLGCRLLRMGQKTREIAEAQKGRFVLRFEEGAHWCEIQNPRDFAARVGEDVFAGFLKCYRGVDQIKTIEGLM